jgi:major vault protein
MSNDNTRDLVLATNQYAYLQDETKGVITVYVGPHKASLSTTDRPMRFQNGRFERCDLPAAIQEFPLVTEGSYLVLQNPAVTKDQAHPPLGTPTSASRLSVGRKINMRGPLSFPLWPGQVATVIEGHRLRSNQYLVVRVYNEEEARQNWDTAVMKAATSETPENAIPATVDLTIGKLIIIKGVDVSFYIPPTGIEVVPDEKGKFIRDAETLERLEYCILLDESGDKSVVKGPSVVFPSPTQTFVEERGSRKFRATELNPDMGIHIKVTADYEENGTTYTTGQELFITGRAQQIYYPRPEHAIIKYGDRQLTYGITIPEGEARYVLNKETGSVDLVRGPRIFLADPRKEVLVRRVLELKEVSLYFPGNAYALDYNAKLLEVLRETASTSASAALSETPSAAICRSLGISAPTSPP